VSLKRECIDDLAPRIELLEIILLCGSLGARALWEVFRSLGRKETALIPLVLSSLLLPGWWGAVLPQNQNTCSNDHGLEVPKLCTKVNISSLEISHITYFIIMMETWLKKKSLAKKKKKKRFLPKRKFSKLHSWKLQQHFIQFFKNVY
jgi:hypothetical protein